MSSSSDRQGGFALLSVLWGLAFLGVLAAAIAAVATDRAHRARNLAEAARAEALADAGFVHGVAHLLEHAGDPLWRADGQPYALDLGDGRVEIVLRDEAGRVDVNYADQALLAGLLAGAGLDAEAAEALADAIQDWSDGDDLRRLNGAEAADYRDAGIDPPANRPFALVAELARVKGMRPDLLRRLEPHLTIHSRQRGLDPTVASAELLALLPGVTPERVEGLVRPAGIQATALGQFIGLDPRHVVASKRQVFSIRAAARTSGGGTFV
ncbi:MAG TPA: hypothetical protein VLL76_02530, partial [Candidatus Omnitrophota bacterium]|nr:hypothetical protein [Candidatus Omnitrophota bacterium]